MVFKRGVAWTGNRSHGSLKGQISETEVLQKRWSLINGSNNVVVMVVVVVVVVVVVAVAVAAAVVVVVKQ